MIAPIIMINVCRVSVYITAARPPERKHQPTTFLCIIFMYQQIYTKTIVTDVQYLCTSNSVESSDHQHEDSGQVEVPS